MNEHDIVRVNETVIATPNFEDTPVEIKAGWRGALIADADKPTPCLEFNEDYRGKPILGGAGRYQFGSGLDSRMKKVVYLRPPIVVKKLASQLEVSPFRLVYDLCGMSVFVIQSRQRWRGHFANSTVLLYSPGSKNKPKVISEENHLKYPAKQLDPKTNDLSLKRNAFRYDESERSRIVQ